MRKIGRYEIRGLLGRGGMSTVFKAAMPVTGKIVALKLMNPPELLVDMIGEEQLRRLFVAEAVTMAGIRHPNIVDVWDFDEHEGRPFFVMEYFCNNLGLFIGEHFRVEEKSRRFDVEKVFHYGRQILDGLSCLHQSGIIHRDIKPYNIMVTDLDTVKIADFGMSKVHGDPFPSPGNIRVGSPFYAAPEQEKDPDSVDGRADVYGAGVLLYRLATGMLPGSGKAFNEESGSILDAGWGAFLTRAVEKDPEKRFSSARVMCDALCELEVKWRDRKELVCRLYSHPEESSEEMTIVRKDPVKIRAGEARKIFNVDDQWRPNIHIKNDFSDHGDGTVSDRATGLLWQKGGGDYHMNWEQAKEYIENLNNQRFGGRSGWRLPTVNELLTLLKPKEEVGDYCGVPAFDEEKRWLWSADLRSYIAAWYVSMDMGFVAWQDFSCLYYVRAVCSQK